MTKLSPTTPKNMYLKHLTYSELALGFSFTCDFHILHPNFDNLLSRSYGYASQKSLHLGTKSENIGSKQKPKTSSVI